MKNRHLRSPLLSGHSTYILETYIWPRPAWISALLFVLVLPSTAENLFILNVPYLFSDSFSIALEALALVTASERTVPLVGLDFCNLPGWLVG